MSEDNLNPAKEKEDLKQNFSDNIWIALQALIIAILFRSLLFQPFSIPSGSMLPTLLIGDYLFVSKYSYGYSKHSLPFSPPLFSDRIMGQDVTRGDVIVFKLPRDNRTDYIKRVVGLPGDTIQVQNGQLYLNGSAVAREKIEDFVSPQVDGEDLKITQYVETLPNGVRYRTLDLVENGRGDNTAIFNVPQG
ncbi:MAG: signal peptidase I, partial [Pseudomonadota bacterium]|nr:signal peptidase I [Pseudomonadota bacterium]